jgi:hypothetical protein
MNAIPGDPKEPRKTLTLTKLTAADKAVIRLARLQAKEQGISFGDYIARLLAEELEVPVPTQEE